LLDLLDEQGFGQAAPLPSAKGKGGESPVIVVVLNIFPPSVAKRGGERKKKDDRVVHHGLGIGRINRKKRKGGKKRRPFLI